MIEINTSKQPLDIFGKILEIPSNKYPGIYRRLNWLEWHESLGEKPEEWDNMGVDEKYSLIKKPMAFMKQSAGEKAILREGHCKEGLKTDQAFEDWWDSWKVEQLLEKLDNIGTLCKEIAQNSAEKGVEQSKAFVFSLLFFLLGLLLGLLF